MAAGTAAAGMTTAMENPGSESEKPERIVVLGASNVARAIVDIAETLVGFRGGPVDLIVAAGHGRSYGARSNVLWRTLPGLTQCGLWQAVSGRPEAGPSMALVTDVGNDLLYGRTPEETMTFVRECVAQLAEHHDRVILTELPVENVRQLGKLRFVAARSLIFPGSPLQYEGLLDKVEYLTEGMRELADEFGADLAVLPPTWYGLDPIHIRMRQQRDAWSRIMSPWRRDDEASAARFTMRERRAIANVRHAYREWFGKPQVREQPAAVLSNGLSLSMY